MLLKNLKLWFILFFRKFRLARVLAKACIEEQSWITLNQWKLISRFPRNTSAKYCHLKLFDTYLTLVILLYKELTRYFSSAGIVFGDKVFECVPTTSNTYHYVLAHNLENKILTRMRSQVVTEVWTTIFHKEPHSEISQIWKQLIK